MGYIGVDLDKTLAYYEYGQREIGRPIPEMLNRVKGWLRQGKEVRIVTARVASDNPPEEVKEQKRMIRAWLKEYVGQELPIQAEKTHDMIWLYDDRAHQVIPNEGSLAVPED